MTGPAPTVDSAVIEQMLDGGEPDSVAEDREHVLEGIGDLAAFTLADDNSGDVSELVDAEERPTKSRTPVASASTSLDSTTCTDTEGDQPCETAANGGPVASVLDTASLSAGATALLEQMAVGEDAGGVTDHDREEDGDGAPRTSAGVVTTHAKTQAQGQEKVSELMRVGASATSSDADRAAAFDEVAKLCSLRGQRGRQGSGFASGREMADAAAAVEGGPQALVLCLSRWGSDASGQVLPFASSAFRAAVALSAFPGPLVALLRAKLLSGLATVLVRGTATGASGAASTGDGPDAPARSTTGADASEARLLRGTALQNSIAGFLAMLSAHAPLGRHMISVGIHVLACKLLTARKTVSISVRQSCCDIISNLALGGGAAGDARGDTAAQAALVAAGAGPGLIRMLSLRNVQALCHASDAIANMTVGAYVPAQNALAGAVTPLVGLLVSAVGPSGQPLPLAVKVARALGNTCQSHRLNQEAAAKANVMPVLAAWMRSGVGPLTRAATAAAANIVVGNPDTTAVAVSSGIVQPLLLLLTQPLASAQAPLPVLPGKAPTEQQRTGQPDTSASTTDPQQLGDCAGTSEPGPSLQGSGDTAAAHDSPDGARTASADMAAPQEPAPSNVDSSQPSEALDTPSTSAGTGGGVLGPRASPTSPGSTASCASQGPQPLPADVFERAATLLSCLAGSSPTLRVQLLRQHGVARLLSSRLAGAGPEGATMLGAGVVMALCGALNNLVSSSDAGSQADVVRAGAVPPLLRLVLYEQRHEGVLRRACHCLASIVMGQKELQDVLLSPLPGAARRQEASQQQQQQEQQQQQRQQEHEVLSNGIHQLNATAGEGEVSSIPPTAAPGSPELPTRLACLMLAATTVTRSASVGASGGAGAVLDRAGGRAYSPSLGAEVARLCGALCFRSNTLAQRRLAEAGVLEALVALLRLNHVAAVCQALMAISNLAGGCVENRRRLLAAGVAVELQRLLRVRGDEVVARAAYCAAVLADSGPTSGPADGDPALASAGTGVDASSRVGDWTDAAAASQHSQTSMRGPVEELTRSSAGAGGEASKASMNKKTLVRLGGSIAGSKDDPTATAAAAAVTISAGPPRESEDTRHEDDDIRSAMAAAGLVPSLVRCLRHGNPDVAARGVAALEALVRGHRENALLVAAAGGIAQLAHLMDLAGGAAVGAAASTAVSAPPKHSTAPAVSSGLGRAVASVAASAARQAPSAAALGAAEAQQAALWRRCVDLWGALGGPGALVRLLSHKAPAVVERAASLIRQVAEGNDEEAQYRLCRADVAAPLLHACRHRNVAVAESALRAVESLARCNPETRTHSIRAGADKGTPSARSVGTLGGGQPAELPVATFRAQFVDAGALGLLQGLQGHKRPAIARLASQAAHSMYVKPGT